ncbi:DUF349 domain-containing protein [Krasilnikoviella flava]|uniref:DUF349 domain-containing protein n=1 Tax=Krasilnikoviella flava TaxID=526729 RepID=A0A1T5L6X4_9MICO|nr:DUF349 domain-containing protein [Krasilnikoviella flava]SKC71475.1 protein of unknown function [Krasilnikoviella flava]
MSESTPGSTGPEETPAGTEETAETPSQTTPDEAAQPTPDADAPADEAPADEAAPTVTSEAPVETVPAADDAAPDPAPAPDQVAPDEAKPAAPKPSAVPKPSRLAGAPKPSALRRPAAPTPADVPPAEPSTTPAAPVVPPALDAAAAAAAEAFGRVDDDGTVYVRESTGERQVGQFPGVSASEAMSLYVRRYLDLDAKVALFETRLDSADLSVREIDQTLTKLAEETGEPAAVGDLDALRARVDGLRSHAAERRAALEQERSAAKAEAVAGRTSIVEAAEKIAATDPAKMQWRPAGEELRALLDRWKEAQRSGPRIDRPTEEALWKRFSHARTAFDRERRHFFADLEQRNSSAKAEKEKLVVDAEALQTSTDWGATAAAYRDLMTRWKAAGRASRKDDDALWARFRAAQDAFFGARDAENAAIDEEYAQNLEVKEALLVEAEALLPVSDLAAAKAKLRDLQDRWEEAGKVPRADVQRVEGRMRAVETAVRGAEQARWDRTNPETRARAEGAAAQLEAAIEGLERDLAEARESGDARRVEEAETALAARRTWLEQVVRAAEETRG